MKNKAKAKRTMGRKAAARESIQDFMLKLSAKLREKAAGNTRPCAVEDCRVATHIKIGGSTMSVGATDEQEAGWTGSLLICIKDSGGCHHLSLPSRTFAQALIERMTRAMRLADEQRRAGAD